MVGIARALVINIGTLSAPWVEAMFHAGRAARRRGIPLVLDPVGCGATSFRTETAHALVKEFRPDVIRGNASEIRALVGGSGATRGVDSLDTPESARSAAEALSLEHGSVVSVSGNVVSECRSFKAVLTRIGHAPTTLTSSPFTTGMI